MGSSRLADALTGLSIPRESPIVALVVERREGGYPDATTHAAMAPMSPSEAFEPVSLPIRGVVGDYLGIEPARNDLGASLMMALAAKPGWKEFSKAAFGVDASVLLGPAARGEKPGMLSRSSEAKPRVLGLVVFTKSNWDRLVSLGTGEANRTRDIRTVQDALTKVRDDAHSRENDVWAMNLDLTRLASSNLYIKDPEQPDGISTTPLPLLARALAGREGGDLMSGIATSGLRQVGMLGHRPPDAEAARKLPQLLGLVWDLQAAENGMDVLCRTWQPSYGAGQYDNAMEIASTALESFADASGHLLDELEEGMSFGEKAVPQLEGMMARLDELRASLGERLEAAQAGTSPAP